MGNIFIPIQRQSFYVSYKAKPLRDGKRERWPMPLSWYKRKNEWRSRVSEHSFMQKPAIQIFSTLPAHDTSRLLKMAEYGEAIKKFDLKSASLVECQIPWPVSVVLSRCRAQHIFLRKQTPSMEDVANSVEKFSHKICRKWALRQLPRPKLSFKAPQVKYTKCPNTQKAFACGRKLNTLKSRTAHKSFCQLFDVKFLQ